MTRTRRFAPLALALLLLAGCGGGGEEKTVLFTPEKPAPTDRITVRYRPDLSPSPLRSEAPLFRFTLLGREGTAAAAELPMERQGAGWEASFVPSEVYGGEPVLLVGAFLDSADPEVADNNRENPWVLLLYDGEKPAAGARYQFFRLLSGEERLDDPLHVPRDRKRAQEELERAVKERPDLAEARFLRWSRALESEAAGPAEAESTLAAARRDADSFFAGREEWTEPPAGTEEALALIALLDGEPARDSLTDELVARFPRTRFASAVLFDRALREEDRAVLADRLARFAEEHPDAEEAVQARTYAAYIRLRSLGDREGAGRLIAGGGEMEPFVLSLYAETLLDEGVRLEEAERTALRAISEEETATFGGDDGRSEAEWTRDRRETLASLLSLLARIREARGDEGGAAKAIGRAVREFPEQATPEALLLAGRLLARTGDRKGALEAYDRLGRTGGADREAEKEWRALWETEGTGDFEAHAARIREAGRAEAMARLDRRALRWPAPPIRFTSAEGDTLTLEEFRGRPVLIDFWATWCGPCRRALPHLQRIHDRRKEEGADLVILPLDVWERSGGEERRGTVREKWEELGLSMPYYLDLDREEGTETAADLFAVPAIPTTCLIGRDGSILFKIVGFDEEKGEEDLRLKIDYALSR